MLSSGRHFWPANGIFRGQHLASDSISAYVIEELAVVVGASSTRRALEDSPLKITFMKTIEDDDELSFNLSRVYPP